MLVLSAPHLGHPVRLATLLLQVALYGVYFSGFLRHTHRTTLPLPLRIPLCGVVPGVPHPRQRGVCRHGAAGGELPSMADAGGAGYVAAVSGQCFHPGASRWWRLPQSRMQPGQRSQTLSKYRG